MQKPNQSITQWVASLFGASTNKALSENLSTEAYNEVVEAVGKLQPVAEESTEDAPENADATPPAPVQNVEALTARITALEQQLTTEQSAKAELQTKFDALSAEHETTKQQLTATQTINAQLRDSVNPVAGDLPSQKVASKRTRAEEEALERRRKKQ